MYLLHILLRFETVAAAADLEAARRLADVECLLHRLRQPQSSRLRKEEGQQSSQYSNHPEDNLCKIDEFSI